MDVKLRNEITRLENSLGLYHTSYVQELEDIEEKMRRLDIQIEKCNSDIKRVILTKQKENYEKQIEKLDACMENNTQVWRDKINLYESQLQEVEREKRSLDYNVEKLNEALERRDPNEIFNMFEYVKNAITIIHDEISQARERV